MGGIFSGRKPSKTTKPFPEQFIDLDIRQLQRVDGLEPGDAYNLHKYKRGEKCGVFNVVVYEDYLELSYSACSRQESRFPTQIISLTRTPCNFGGYRPWFLCPGDQCGRRVAILYGPYSMLCRHCWGIAYQSQREDTLQRMHRKLRSIEAKYPKRLFTRKPETQKRSKGMHNRTFELLETKRQVQMREITRLEIEEMIRLEESFPECF